MKKYSFIHAAAAIAMTVSCAEKAIDIVPAEGMKTIEIAVSMDDTKAALDGKSVVWKDGDKVAVFDGINEAANEFTVSGASGKTAFISGSVSEQAATLQAVYPFNSALSAKADTINFKVSQPQIIPAGADVDPAALVCVAKAEVGENLNFKNVASLLKFEITEDNINSILVIGNNNEAFCGESAVYFEGTEVKIEGASKKRMKIAPEGECFAKGAYYATVLPTTMEGGITFVTNSRSAKYVKSSTKAVSFVRNGGVNFGGIIGTEKLPIAISTKEELLKWASNASLYLKAETVKLEADIDLGGDEWTPVQSYCGSFDGQNHSIYNFTVTASKQTVKYIGLFSVIEDGNTVKDLKLGYSPVSGAADGTSKILVDNNVVTHAAPLAGVLRDYNNDTVKVVNVKCYVPVSVKKSTDKNDLRMAGVAAAVGQNSSPVYLIDCENYGNIQNESAAVIGGSVYFGGILATTSSGHMHIINCSNHGTVIPSTSSKVGGTQFMGGIIGRVGASLDGIVISGCKNDGEIKSVYQIDKALYMGGIMGFDNSAVEAEGYNIIIENCENSGNVSIGAQSPDCFLGGIAGGIRSKIRITGCKFSGKITKSANNNSNSHYGGIVGKAEEASGLAGAVIENCEVSGTIAETGGTKVQKQGYYGGIAGLGDVTIKDCTFSGKISTTVALASETRCVGGIAGFHGSFPITGCTVTAEITTPSNYAGGIVGYQKDAAVQTGEGCKVNANVAGEATKAGMLIGSYAGPSAFSFGSAAAPVKVGGKFGDTVIDATNLNAFLTGSASPASPTYSVVLYSAE